jgi:hypothetical protein
MAFRARFYAGVVSLSILPLSTTAEIKEMRIDLCRVTSPGFESFSVHRRCNNNTNNVFLLVNIQRKKVN